MKKYIVALFITSAFLTSNNCLAWGEKGHALVAQYLQITLMPIPKK